MCTNVELLKHFSSTTPPARAARNQKPPCLVRAAACPTLCLWHVNSPAGAAGAVVYLCFLWTLRDRARFRGRKVVRESNAMPPAVKNEEVPPPGWRRPYWYEPKGGFVRIQDVEPTNTERVASSREGPVLEHATLSCGSSARNGKHHGPRGRAQAGSWISWLSWLVPDKDLVNDFVCVGRRTVYEDVDDGQDNDPMPPGLQARFQSALEAINERASKTPLTYELNSPSDAWKLRLYALFMQATKGRPQGAPPPWFDKVASAKYESWMVLGRMSRARAMVEYCIEAERQLKKPEKAESKTGSKLEFSL